MLCRQQSKAYIMWGGQRIFKKDTSIYRAVCLNVCMWVCFQLLDKIMQHNVQVDKVAPKLDMTHCSIFSGAACQACVFGLSSSGACTLCRHINYLGHILQWAEGEHDSGIWILLQQSTRSTVVHIDMKTCFCTCLNTIFSPLYSTPIISLYSLDFNRLHCLALDSCLPLSLSLFLLIFGFLLHKYPSHFLACSLFILISPLFHLSCYALLHTVQ